MNKYQKSLRDCFKLTVAEAKKNSITMELIPKFKEGIEKLDKLNIEIDALQIKQEKDNTGITTDINLIVDQLIDYMIDLSGAMQSYATEKNNNALLERISLTESGLDRMSKQELVNIAILLVEESAKLSAEELLNHGIGANDMVELKRLYDIVNQEGQAPKHIKIETSGYTNQLKLKVDEANKLKKNVLDKLATQFKRKDPDFYLIYQSASNVSTKKASKKNANDSNVGTETGENPVK